MTRSGLADSPFFTAPVLPAPAPAAERPARTSDSVQKENSAIKQADKPASLPSSQNASMHASVTESMVELIRKTVKEVGKESTTFRFTPEEKRTLLELAFSYKVQGFKTSENELARIALHFLLEDHKQNGKNSLLAQVLQALHQ